MVERCLLTWSLLKWFKVSEFVMKKVWFESVENGLIYSDEGLWEGVFGFDVSPYKNGGS